MAQPSVHQLYERLETIGKGAYGSVHKGRHKASGKLVALKIIDLDTADDDVEDIQREVALLTQLRDAPNVTQYFGCYLDGPRVWIIMEYAQGGSVRDLMNISRDGTLEEKYVVVIIREVLLGLSYLHKSSIIHRDIKAANVLITAAGKVMICDFGVSALLATASSKRNTLMGTPNWMAPEVAQTVPAYDTRADIWSMGIMIYEMVKGSPPHVGIDKFKVIQLIPRVAPPRLVEGEGSKDMRDFVSYCLKESPNDRLSADELSKTKWIKSISKVSVTILRDLILRFEAWKQGGGSRDSLALPLAWEEEEEKDLQSIENDNQSLWEFDTVRSRSSRSVFVDDDPSDTAREGSFSSNTIRPPASSKLPSSLRHLFDDESSTQSDSLHAMLHIPISPNPLPLLPSLTRDRGPFKKTLDENHEKPDPVLHANFSFPPRPPAQVKSVAPVARTGDNERLPPPESEPPQVPRKNSIVHLNSSGPEASSQPSQPTMTSPEPVEPTPSLVALQQTRKDSSDSIGPPSPLRSSSPDLSTTLDSSLSTQITSTSYSRANTTSTSFTSASSSISMGPAMRPLDFAALMASHDATHAELAQTVEDLTQWLSVVEHGLTNVLDSTYDSIIEEEQEDQISILSTQA